MKRRFDLLLPMFALAAGLAASVAQAQTQSAPDKLDRTVLPIPEPKFPPITELDARNAKAPPPFSVKAPAGAPKVLIVLIDDMGFGQSSAFGGPVHMPTLDRMAKGGLKYNKFHTTALCSPTRAAPLSGRNYHVGNMGSITETATAFPGQTGKRPNCVKPLAEMLRLNGYRTAAFGKSHETAAWEVSPSGPTDGWLAHTVHRAGWEQKPRRPFLEDKWELYNVDVDFSSANDKIQKVAVELK